jgi:hypothetical protein
MSFDIDLRDPGDKFDVELITQDQASDSVWFIWIEDEEL